jgi:hypothetical protein
MRDATPKLLEMARPPASPLPVWPSVLHRCAFDRYCRNCGRSGARRPGGRRTPGGVGTLAARRGHPGCPRPGIRRCCSPVHLGRWTQASFLKACARGRGGLAGRDQSVVSLTATVKLPLMPLRGEQTNRSQTHRPGRDQPVRVIFLTRAGRTSAVRRSNVPPSGDSAREGRPCEVVGPLARIGGHGGQGTRQAAGMSCL